MHLVLQLIIGMVTAKSRIKNSDKHSKKLWTDEWSRVLTQWMLCLHQVVLMFQRVEKCWKRQPDTAATIQMGGALNLSGHYTILWIGILNMILKTNGHI